MISQYLQDHLIRVAKMLRPQTELERMTAVAEDACFGFIASYGVDMNFTDAKATVYEKHTPTYDITPLAYDAVRKIDAQVPQQKRLLNKVRFGVLTPVFIDGLWYYDKYPRMIRRRYTKSRVLRGLYIPNYYEHEFLFHQTIEDNFANAFPALGQAIADELGDIDWEDDQQPPAPTHAEPDAEVDAFIAEIDALLAEDDDTPIYEDRLPKAAPTG